MATRQSTMDYLLDLLKSNDAPVTARKMFGDYTLYWQDKTVALVCDDQLFVKPTPSGEALILNVVTAIPYPGGKPCLLITADQWEESDWLSTLLQETAAALPTPKPKKNKPSKNQKNNLHKEYYFCATINNRGNLKRIRPSS